MSKKKYLSPYQMQFLTGSLPWLPSADDGVEAKPDPFLDEEEEIILPDGGVVSAGEGDVIIPDVSGDSDFNVDEAYY